MSNNVIRKATNRWTKGLVMDFSPENTKNELLTHALNATLLTFNGNELSLQNDMGNARVETAYLPEGYMPVGTCEYGGIIYIVSYNPLEDKSQIGCFPSPERNISSDELGISDKYIDRNYFQKFIDGVPDESGTILHNTQYVLLKNDNLNPGDKFIVCSDKQIYNEKLQNLFVAKDKGEGQAQESDFEPVNNPVIALNVVSIEDSGKIVYLNSDIRHYEVQNSYQVDGGSHTDTYKYHILGKMMEGTSQLAKEDLDSYRDVLSSGYSVFKSKTSGRLAILAELIMIDSYSVTHSVVPRKDESDNIVEGAFDVVIHTDITPTINESNYNLVPKLQYYYLDNSQGYIQVAHPTKVNDTIPLFEIDKDGNNTGKYNLQFLDTQLSEVYEQVSEETLNLNQTLRKAGQFNFPKPYTYNGRMTSYDGEVTGIANNSVFTKFIEGKYHRLSYNQISDNIDYYKDDIMAKFYYFDASGKEYQEYTDKEINESYTYYVEKPQYFYHDVKRDTKYNTPEQELYKLITAPKAAEDIQIEDKTIEKYQYQEIISFRKATAEEIENSSDKLYYKDDTDGTYIQLIGQPDPNIDYYIRESEENLVPIGKDVIKEEIKGAVYYYPDEKTYELASEDDKKKYFDFITYPYTPTEPYGSPINLYRQEEKLEYEVATQYQITHYKELKIKLYYNTNYILVPEIEHYGRSNQLFIVVPIDTFVSSKYFIPNTSDNRINGRLNNEPAQGYPKDDEIFLYTVADFIPNNDDENEGNYLNYNDLKLANIKIPSVVSLNGLDLPFKYDYTIVPCMNYGKLQHLAVSNTVDFGKLHAFNQSTFSTWKYRIDNNQLRLTFGADVYDTYETNQVDGLVLEFYDCWGFAGSLEIVDKKSYSGIFTKIISLNSHKALSRKRILENDYSEKYVRNINIKEKFNEETKALEYTFNDKPVSYIDSTEGWSGIDDENNDCGTLYSNILYGVKAYLRRPTKNGREFLHKQDFFLYTLPIYNDYYFTVNDFSTLTYPELNFILTYKLKDSSSKQVFTNDIINGGYNEQDKTSIDSYLGGFYKEKSLDITKYYKYKGTTDLYLEIGLEQSYENLNISYDPSINSLFGCTLKLISDNDVNTPLTVSSDMEGLTGHSTILNYKDLINSDVNVLNFENADGNLHQKTIKSLSNHMFINTQESVVYEPIKINYEFVVGYNASITDITDTQVQVTTVCALCHKQQDTEQYNYEDFGVYESDGKFLSSVMFYNEGTSKEEIFGICRQIKTQGTITEQCQKGPNVVTEAQKITTAGKLNTGEPLKQLINNIGKLTFCQPHAHGLSDQINGVNVYYKMTNTQDKNTLILYPEYGGNKIGNHYEDNYGTYATSNLFNNPKYNLVVNTKNSINYNSEFMSTTDFKETTSRFYKFDSTGGAGGGYTDGEIKVREFTGLTGEQLEVFNRKLVETFKNVYAYNPDYDSLTVNKGNVSLQNYNPNFSTNIISTDSVINYLGETTLNDYIYLGPVKFSDYLNKLANRSNIQVSNDDGFMPQVQLTENLQYCGVKGSNYLISSLTYNTPVPFEIEQELEFSASNLTVIKHQDGTNSFMEGTPNKKALYGFISKYNKMIELDVSNYEIDADGKLSVIDEGTKEPISGNKELNITSSIQLQNYYFDYSFKNSKDELSSLKLALYLSVNGYNSSELLGFSQFQDEIIFASKITRDYGYWLDGGLTINPSFRVISSDNKYSYEIEPTKLDFEFKFVELNDKLSLYPWSYDKPSLYNQSLDTINTLLSRSGSITLENSNLPNDYVQNYLADHSGLEESLIVNGQYYYSSWSNDFTDASVKLQQNKRVDIKCNRRPESDYQYIILLISFKFNKLEFIINQKSKLETIEENFVKVVKSKKYTDDSIPHKYKVDGKYNKARIRGTSITLNDLEYINNKDGHRLFVKNGLHNYDSYARNKIYYRKLEDGQDSYYEDTKYLNNIFLYTGPCFTTDNLNYNSTIDG